MSSSLADAPLRETRLLADVRVADATRRRLAELGLRPGAEVRVLRRTAGGGRILDVAGARIAVDLATARALLVGEGVSA